MKDKQKYVNNCMSHLHTFGLLHGPTILADRQPFGECSIFNLTLSVLRERLVIDQFFHSFLCFSLVKIIRQTSYDSGILRQDYGIIRGFIGHHLSVNLV